MFAVQCLSKACFGRYPPGDVESTGSLAVVGMGGRPRVLVAPTHDRARVVSAVTAECVEAAGEGGHATDLAAALATAALVARGAARCRAMAFVAAPLSERSFAEGDPSLLAPPAQRLRRRRVPVDLVVFAADGVEAAAARAHYAPLLNELNRPGTLDAQPASRLVVVEPPDEDAPMWQQVEGLLEQLELDAGPTAPDAGLSTPSAPDLARMMSAAEGGADVRGAGAGEEPPARAARRPAGPRRGSALPVPLAGFAPGTCRSDSLDAFLHLSSDGMMRPWLPSYASIEEQVRNSASGSEAARLGLGEARSLTLDEVARGGGPGGPIGPHEMCSVTLHRLKLPRELPVLEFRCGLMAEGVPPLGAGGPAGPPPGTRLGVAGVLGLLDAAAGGAGAPACRVTRGEWLEADPRRGLAVVSQTTGQRGVPGLVLRWYDRAGVVEPGPGGVFDPAEERALPAPEFEMVLRRAARGGPGAGAGAGGGDPPRRASEGADEPPRRPSARAVPGRACVAVSVPRRGTAPAATRVLWLQEEGDGGGGAEARAAWVAARLSELLDSTAPVDATSPALLAKYGEPLRIGPIPFRILRECLPPLGALGLLEASEGPPAAGAERPRGGAGDPGGGDAAAGGGAPRPAAPLSLSRRFQLVAQRAARRLGPHGKRGAARAANDPSAAALEEALGPKVGSLVSDVLLPDLPGAAAGPAGAAAAGGGGGDPGAPGDAALPWLDEAWREHVRGVAGERQEERERRETEAYLEHMASVMAESGDGASDGDASRGAYRAGRSSLRGAPPGRPAPARRAGTVPVPPPREGARGPAPGAGASPGAPPSAAAAADAALERIERMMMPPGDGYGAEDAAPGGTPGAASAGTSAGSDGEWLRRIGGDAGGSPDRLGGLWGRALAAGGGGGGREVGSAERRRFWSRLEEVSRTAGAGAGAAAVGVEGRPLEARAGKKKRDDDGSALFELD